MMLPVDTIVWTDDPLLADYFIVPHDLMYLYFRNNPKILSRGSHEKLRSTLNKVYFERFMINLQKRFPFWTMAENAPMMGSNHIFTFVGPKNMAFLHTRYRRLLKNVIQLVFTGTRSELPAVRSFINRSTTECHCDLSRRLWYCSATICQSRLQRKLSLHGEEVCILFSWRAQW